MSDLMAQLRAVVPIFLVVALILVFGVFVARRAGLFADTVTVTGNSAAFTAAGTPADSSGSGSSEGGDNPAATSNDTAAASRDLRIVTLLPKDAIPAIFDPSFVTREEADRLLRPEDQVIGVSINGDHRAYGTAFLSSREVVNDTVGGRPIMVTW